MNVLKCIITETIREIMDNNKNSKRFVYNYLTNESDQIT